MSSRVLDKPSDLFFAIGDAILAADLGVDVGNYDDFSGVVGDATVLIEIERDGHGRRASDGRAAHDLTISLHGVVARWRAHSPLEAVNLASLLKALDGACQVLSVIFPATSRPCRRCSPLVNLGTTPGPPRSRRRSISGSRCSMIL